MVHTGVPSKGSVPGRRCEDNELFFETCDLLQSIVCPWNDLVGRE